MAPGLPYFGPISMADSRYASPMRRKQVEALLASNPALQAKKETDNVLAIREQIAAGSAAVPFQSTGVQLAQAQGQALEQEIAQHRLVIDQTILNMITDAIKQDRPDTADASLKVVANLQQELQKLVEATRRAQGALPYFLERQKENSSLLASTKIQEAHRDIQQELALKDKKILLGQELHLEQQQAYKDVEANANNRTTELQERLTRIHMEHGLLKTELEGTNAQLKKAQATENDAVKAREELEEKLSMLKESKDSLSAKNANIRGTIKDLENKLQAAEKKATEHYEKELRSLTDQLQKEHQKATSLEANLKMLRQADETSRREVEKAKAESKLLSEKYNDQSREYAKVADDFKEQMKKANRLDGEVRDLRQQKSEIEKERNRVTFLKDSLQKQHAALKAEHGESPQATIFSYFLPLTDLDDLKQKDALVKEEAQQLSAKLKRAENENDHLETKNNNLLAKQLENDSAAAALKKADTEIATLRATVESLRSKPTAANDSADAVALRKELEQLSGKYTKSESDLVEWEELGRRAMLRYREIASKYQQLEGVETQLKQVLAQNEQVQAQNKQVLAQNEQLKVKATSGSNSDAKYWRDKYNELLKAVEG
ncbi:uncharacterized protein N0V89_006491 [Didymosphaeria variabile]|uniref:Uncharacterized protein n=1 Tax=Didymosphaeria variabile TaxID=1932322 RepID=A0A9W8XHW8_9PLEO|nr:uncharacterized protein N0V89_006491 [Didymosphaeria variabile]KAJ4351152.1 hypothetical protein N0V89_006491 [Didymosphaeria variabile]